MPMTAYPHLLSPLDLGFAILPNRVLMGSMHLRLGEAGQGFERMAAFYAARARGGVGADRHRRPAPPRTVHLLQRRPGKVGAGLGRSTGWIHRSELTHRGVTMIAGATYERSDHEGLHITLEGRPRVIPADTVVVCAGQEPNRDLYKELRVAAAAVHVIGGADLATELDAKRAIRQGTELAAAL
jgi:2,4-dienoyl-CoA reductase (NADPH2)